MSAPAFWQALIWATVAATSSVSVLVIVCTEIGASPPTATRPTLIWRVRLLAIVCWDFIAMGVDRLLRQRQREPRRVVAARDLGDVDGLAFELDLHAWRVAEKDRQRRRAGKGLHLAGAGQRVEQVLAAGV